LACDILSNLQSHYYSKVFRLVIIVLSWPTTRTCYYVRCSDILRQSQQSE